MPQQIAAVFFLFNLNDPTTYSGLLDVLQYQQRTGKWPPIPPIPPILQPTPRNVKATASVNIRSGPGATFPIIGLLKASDGVVEWVEEKDGWTHIVHKKPHPAVPEASIRIDGWCSTKYLVAG